MESVYDSNYLCNCHGHRQLHFYAATSHLGILESRIRSDDNVDMISLTSSSSRLMVYSSNIGWSRLSASTDDGTHKHVSPKIQTMTQLKSFVVLRMINISLHTQPRTGNSVYSFEAHPSCWYFDLSLLPRRRTERIIDLYGNHRAHVIASWQIAWRRRSFQNIWDPINVGCDGKIFCTKELILSRNAEIPLVKTLN